MQERVCNWNIKEKQRLSLLITLVPHRLYTVWQLLIAMDSSIPHLIPALLSLLAVCLTYFFTRLHVARSQIWEKQKLGLVGSPSTCQEPADSSPARCSRPFFPSGTLAILQESSGQASSRCSLSKCLGWHCTRAFSAWRLLLYRYVACYRHFIYCRLTAHRQPNTCQPKYVNATTTASAAVFQAYHWRT